MSSFRLAIPLFLPLVVGMAFLTGACGAPLAVTGASYAADGGLLVTSNKTAGDHLASMISKKDCALWRVPPCPPGSEGHGGGKEPLKHPQNPPPPPAPPRGVADHPPRPPAPPRAPP